MSLAERSPRADTIERAERAYFARVSGATWTQAAEVAGYTDAANCCRAVRRVFDELPAPDREHQRHLVRDRLDTLYRLALKDAHDRRPGAVTSAVRVLELMSRLDGLTEDRMRILHDPTQHQIDEFLNQYMPEQYEKEDDFFDVEDAEIIGD